MYHDPDDQLAAARLPDGRLLLARLDPDTPEHHSPLRRVLRDATDHPQTEPTP